MSKFNQLLKKRNHDYEKITSGSNKLQHNHTVRDSSTMLNSSHIHNEYSNHQVGNLGNEANPARINKLGDQLALAYWYQQSKRFIKSSMWNQIGEPKK